MGTNGRFRSWFYMGVSKDVLTDCVCVTVPRISPMTIIQVWRFSVEISLHPSLRVFVSDQHCLVWVSVGSWWWSKGHWDRLVANKTTHDDLFLLIPYHIKQNSVRNEENKHNVSLTWFNCTLNSVWGKGRFYFAPFMNWTHVDFEGAFEMPRIFLASISQLL